MLSRRFRQTLGQVLVCKKNHETTAIKIIVWHKRGMTVFQCTCVTDTIKDSPLACVDDACLARERKTVVKTRAKHARTAAKLIMPNKQTASCAGYWVSVPLLPYISKFLQFHEILLKIKLHQCSSLIAAFLGACKPWGKR